MFYVHKHLGRDRQNKLKKIQLLNGDANPKFAEIKKHVVAKNILKDLDVVKSPIDLFTLCILM